MFIVAFVIAGWAVLFMLFWRMLARDSARVRAEAQKQIESLSARVADLEQTIAIAHALRPPDTAGKNVSAAAGIAVLVSEKVMVRSVRKPLTMHPLGDPWAQQGRAGIQSSHDIAQREH
jgi:hypothetical protein